MKQSPSQSLRIVLVEIFGLRMKEILTVRLQTSYNTFKLMKNHLGGKNSLGYSSIESERPLCSSALVVRCNINGIAIVCVRCECQLNRQFLKFNERKSERDNHMFVIIDSWALLCLPNTHSFCGMYKSIFELAEFPIEIIGQI